MSETQVTITLGRSGQKVVKRPWAGARTPRDDSQTLSGKKRSMVDAYGRRTDDSFMSNVKRVRGGDDSRSSGLNGARIGRNDLRLKLMRKRMSETQRMTKIRKKICKAIRSVEQSERSTVRNAPMTRSNNELQGMDSLRSSYSSRTSGGLGLNSPDAFAKASVGISATRYIKEMQHIPSSRPIEASRSGHVVSGNVLNPSRTKVPLDIPLRTTLDARKPVTRLPISSGSIRRSSLPDSSTLTVSSFLHLLGLEKYAIHFQAEEVDMAALKQMGDRDLKELGLPMGPRKKIVLALLPPPKRPSA